MAFGPAAVANWMLWRLPSTAAANGAGQGAPWQTAALAAGVAVLALIAGAIIAWRLIERFPRSVAVLPVIAVFVAVVGRGFAVSGAPEEFYLLDDAKLWIVLLGLGVLLASLLAAAPVHPKRPAI